MLRHTVLTQMHKPIWICTEIILFPHHNNTLASATGSSKNPSGRTSLVFGFGGSLGLGCSSLNMDSSSFGLAGGWSSSKNPSGKPRKLTKIPWNYLPFQLMTESNQTTIIIKQSALCFCLCCVRQSSIINRISYKCKRIELTDSS